SLIGLTDDHIAVALTDTLGAPLPAAPAIAMGAPAGTPLQVAGSAAALEAATYNVQVERRAAIGSPGLLAGFDTGNPPNEPQGLLPTVGVTIPLPIFNRNRGPIAEAVAKRAGASADLAQVRYDNRLGTLRAQRELAAASSRVTRDRDLLVSAARVSQMSMTQYREGAAPLANVLEAQRTAREVEGQYYDDAAAALIAVATLRLLTLTPEGITP
ncbi:MAG: TolC family protein, partial [Gemmatimonadales bacterium]